MVRKPGLPDGLNLLKGVEVPKEERPAPIRTGDYFDAILDSRPVRTAVPATTKARPDAPPMPESLQGKRSAGDDEEQQALFANDGNTDPSQARRKTFYKPKPQSAKRYRVNIGDEEYARLEEICEIVTKSSPEKGKVSEILDALVNALYEERKEMDFSRMRRRGRWGSQEHMIYRAVLKDVVKRAISGR